jgi:hypothetical protein
MRHPSRRELGQSELGQNSGPALDIGLRPEITNRQDTPSGGRCPTPNASMSSPECESSPLSNPPGAGSSTEPSCVPSSHQRKRKSTKKGTEKGKSVSKLETVKAELQRRKTTRLSVAQCLYFDGPTEIAVIILAPYMY